MQWGLQYYILTFGLILNSFILCVFSLSSGTNSQRDHWGCVGPQQSALVVWREGGGCGRLWRPSVDLRHRRGTDDSRVLLNTSLIPKQWDAVWRLCEQNVIVCWTQLIFNVLPYRLYWFLWIRSFWLWHVSNKLEQFNRRLLRWQQVMVSWWGSVILLQNWFCVNNLFPDVFGSCWRWTTS